MLKKIASLSVLMAAVTNSKASVTLKLLSKPTVSSLLKRQASGLQKHLESLTSPDPS